jgi:hypothetical protein
MIRMLWEKMMKWGWDYNRGLRTFSSDDCDLEDTQDRGVDLPDPLEFKVQPAQGGTIVEVTNWDKTNEESIVKLHIIPDGENIADHVGKIVVMEMLRR